MEEFEKEQCHIENECECILGGQPCLKREKAVILHDASLQNIVNDQESWPAHMNYYLHRIAHKLS